MDLHSAFKIAARRIAQQDREYTELHKAHGIEEAHWVLLTQAEYWTPDQARAIRSILANVVEVSMTIAGMPAVPLPGQYVAAVICEVVAPANWVLAAQKSPDTFNAFDASGMLKESEVVPMKFEQMLSLVFAYAGGYQGEPANLVYPRTFQQQVQDENTKERVQKTN